VTYRGEGREFIWENLVPSEKGELVLKDDRHLRPEYRLRCSSRAAEDDPAVFDDFTKGEVEGRRRLTYGVPVSTFGGPGGIVPGPALLKRDVRGGFWLYLSEGRPRLTKYDAGLSYQFSLRLPAAVVDFDTDGNANLYALLEGNRVLRCNPWGREIRAWRLPFGRSPGAFVAAAGIAADKERDFVYLSDRELHRVQRFSLDLSYRPWLFSLWGWIGWEDLSYIELGSYRAEGKWRLDRPRQLLVEPDGNLMVSNEHFISRFDLEDGRQLPFGEAPVLGWGGTFEQSPNSRAAGENGKWERHWLAGVDGSGDIYVADQTNAQLLNGRIQRFSREGRFEASFDLGSSLSDAGGRPAYIIPQIAVATARASEASPSRVWLVEGGGHIYESEGISSGGILHLGPGAPGRQFDLGQTKAEEFTVEAQPEYVRHEARGLIMGWRGKPHSTSDCEVEGRAAVLDGETSLWLPVRLGEAFKVTVKLEGAVLPESDYGVEVESGPGAFGSGFDYVRLTNRSGKAWKEAEFEAVAVGPE
jgi:hypothetical protein